MLASSPKRLVDGPAPEKSGAGGRGRLVGDPGLGEPLRSIGSYCAIDGGLPISDADFDGDQERVGEARPE